MIEAQSIRTSKCKRRLRPLVADAERLARLLGCGVRSIRTWDYAGKLPRPVKLGNRTLWVLSEIHRWLTAGAPDRETWETLKAEAALQKEMKGGRRRSLRGLCSK